MSVLKKYTPDIISPNHALVDSLIAYPSNTSNTCIDCSGVTGVTGCPPITQLDLLVILDMLEIIPIFNGSKDLINLSTPNGLYVDTNRWLNAYEKFNQELPGNGGISAYVSLLIRTLFENVASSTEGLYITMLVVLIMQSFILFIIVMISMWIYKLMRGRICVLFIFIAFVISLCAFVVILVVATRTSIDVDAAVSKVLGGFSGTVLCSLNSAVNCFVGEDCVCPTVVPHSKCKNTLFEPVTDVIDIYKDSIGGTGTFFYMYEPIIMNSYPDVRYTTGIVRITTTSTGVGQNGSGSVQINNLPFGDYLITELEQPGWTKTEMVPSNGVVTVSSSNSTQVPPLNAITFTNALVI